MRKRKFRKGPLPLESRVRQRQVDPQAIRALYRAIEATGTMGITLAEVARHLGWSYGLVQTRLMTLDREGLLMAEYKGRLFALSAL